MVAQAVLARARAWVLDDPDEATAAEVTALCAAAEQGDDAAAAELGDRFAGTLQFGTAGLRGVIGGGSNRMNRAVVLRAAAGLTAYLTRTLAEQGAERPRVVIGYDARHYSSVFAHDTAAVVTAAGGEALLMPQEWPTPVLAFAVRHLDADAGVMVTASHNPAADNGYKVYLGGRVVTDSGQGAQIVPPYDAAIAAEIAAVKQVADIARAPGGWRVLDDDVHTAYLAALAEQPAHPGVGSLRVVTTAMHGVGGATLTSALVAAGVTDLHTVPEQAEPDPAFPTVAFPNPEEPGAMDLAVQLAGGLEANVIIAVDPDADRCAVAIPAPGHDGGWRRLSGDETGALLGEHVASGVTQPGAVLASSIVSSRQLASIARAHGLRHRATLTGFKWISRVPDLAFGYEEALGYCVLPAAVRDKDGISAALAVVNLLAAARERGSDLQGELDALALRDGLVATAPVTVRVTDLALIGEAMARLRTAPPAALGGSEVTRVVDLTGGLEVPDPDGLNGGAYTVPGTDGLLLETADGSRVIVRPSGTEPKLKAYLEVQVAVADAEALPAARATAQERLAAIVADVRSATGM
ncbi:phospho-sugar mutase [Litorihabitans aurantiacus]|uniref:Phosphomannomutase n=1 Tax=Litorihabitans aurantiacus TaxID=1930061 RepID=A0AA37XF21_9MICO|nr:phospho-sugar mutase [Litorihabitans aurantiacus]GMA32158.1 phosphomannomutase [Litorihabitans aurantiacus]